MSERTIEIKKLSSSGVNDYTLGCCLASVSGHQINEFSGCRAFCIDITLDAVHSPKDYKADLNNVRAMSTAFTTANIKVAEDFLHQFETECGLELTEISRVPAYRNNIVYHFKGDKLWVHLPMLSLYLAFLRNMRHHKIGQPWRKALPLCEYDIVNAIDLIKAIAKYTPRALFGDDVTAGYPKTSFGGQLHSVGINVYAGIICGKLNNYTDKMYQLAFDARDRLKFLEAPPMPKFIEPVGSVARAKRPAPARKPRKKYAEAI
jgi:hypothetical protein